MKRLKLKLMCDCGYEEELNENSEISGACPKCYQHKGNVEYVSALNADSFVNVLSQYNESEISKYAEFISIAAESISRGL